MLRHLLILVVFTYFVWEVSCSNNVLLSGPNGKCVCKDQSCADNISCEKHNTICIKRAIQALQNQKDAKYSKAFLAKYKEIITTRGQCTDNCEKRCNDSAISGCSKEAQARFICKWNALLKEISTKDNKEHVASFVDDVLRIGAECTNKDCKPKCQGPDQCNPQFKQASEKCVKKVYNDLLSSVKSDDIKASLVDSKRNALHAIEELERCEKISAPKARDQCIQRVKLDAKVDEKSLHSQLEAQVGSCSAANIKVIVEQGLVLCNLSK